MIKASSMMQIYHETADRINLDSRNRARIVDKADMLIIRLLMGKEVDARVTSMEQAAGEAMQSMIDAFPVELGLLENPWSSFLVGDQPSSSTNAPTMQASGSSLVEYNIDGSNALRLSLAHHGYEVNKVVFIKEEPHRLYKIIDLQESVKIRELSPITGDYLNKQVLVIDPQKFMMQYILKSVDVELTTDFPGNTIFGTQVLRSSVAVAHCTLFCNR